MQQFADEPAEHETAEQVNHNIRVFKGSNIGRPALRVYEKRQHGNWATTRSRGIAKDELLECRPT
ncbi:MAG: hypothetical protein JKY86_10805 [Gammaproteobacteria bacterium]|nr:hypothetical protein [Gammaproteobacteria bacterium]